MVFRFVVNNISKSYFTALSTLKACKATLRLEWLYANLFRFFAYCKRLLMVNVNF